MNQWFMKPYKEYSYSKRDLNPHSRNGQRILSPSCLPFHHSSILSKRAENETRTRDPNLGKVMLYQLSYFRIVCFSFASAKVVQIFILPNISGEKFNYGGKFYYRLYRRHIVWGLVSPQRKVLPPDCRYRLKVQIYYRISDKWRIRQIRPHLRWH